MGKSKADFRGSLLIFLKDKFNAVRKAKLTAKNVESGN